MSEQTFPMDGTFGGAMRAAAAVEAAKGPAANSQDELRRAAAKVRDLAEKAPGGVWAAMGPETAEPLAAWLELEAGWGDDAVSHSVDFARALLNEVQS